MVVLRAVERLAGVDEWVHFNTHPVDVEAGDVEDLQLDHDGFGVGARTDIADESD